VLEKAVGRKEEQIGHTQAKAENEEKTDA